MQMYLLRMPDDESVYIRTVLENYEALKRALSGEEIHCRIIKGLSGISLAGESQISTPWGVVKPAPRVNDDSLIQLYHPKTTCLLVEQQLIPIAFDRASSPDNPFKDILPNNRNTNNLFQLACALSSEDLSKPAVPIVTWSTTLLPFNIGSGYSMAQLPYYSPQTTNVTQHIAEIEEWARTVNKTHSKSIDIAAQRLISAIAHRTDKCDSLIDAVMVWENLVGTDHEVTFRVSAALATLIESNDQEKRKALYKKIKNIYGLRSRIVHGSSTEAKKTENASTTAIEIAIKALRVGYHKGDEWLSLNSTERSDNVLLNI